MEYISIKNLEKYQPKYKDGRRLLWIRWDVSAMRDYKISQMPDNVKWLFVALTCLAIEHQNMIPNDPKWIATQIGSRENHISKSLLMLQTLELIVKVCNELENSTFKTCTLRNVTERNVTERNKSSAEATPDFLTILKTNPVYSHINFDVELGKMDGWLLAHPGRQKTKRFIVGWLNKIEKPLPINKPIDNTDAQIKADKEKMEKMKSEAVPMPEDCKAALAKVGVRIPCKV